MTSHQRFRKSHPCPICHGYEEATRGNGERCFGYLSDDGHFAHCTREEHAGKLSRYETSETYAHKLVGNCLCGVRHDPTTDDRSSRNGHHQPREVCAYSYRDADGALLYQVVRFTNPKTFRQRRPDGNGGWIYNLKGVRRVPYRLPEIMAAIRQRQTVCIAEGEADVDTLLSHGHAATTNPMGAKKWRDEYSRALKDATDVVIFGDNDDEGRAHVAQVTASLRRVGITPRIAVMDGLPPHGDVREWLATHTADDLATVIAKAVPTAEDQSPHVDSDWKTKLSTSDSGIPRETLGNVTWALQHLEPWATQCWYDEVHDLLMVGTRELDNVMVTEAGLALERETRMHVRSKHLVPTALSYLCHQRPRDLLLEWLEGLPAWDRTPRLSTWLQTYAHAFKNAYSQDVSRLLIVSAVARALNPGCQYRYVVILEGPENAGKTKLVRALATPDWYRELSHGLDGKEAHMRIKRCWFAELAELSSLTKTEEARLKSFFTMNEDAYIPKFSNFEVVHKRRTVFVGTVNPEGDNTYLRGQTGNTRYLPIEVRSINIEGFEAVRSQVFAEALVYYREHLEDWWRLSSQGEDTAQEAREERRQRSVYEDSLSAWLERNKATVTWWEDIAQNFLLLAREKWADRRTQMEVAKALKAIGWYKGKRERVDEADKALIVPWRPGSDWRVEP